MGSACYVMLDTGSVTEQPMKKTSSVYNKILHLQLNILQGALLHLLPERYSCLLITIIYLKNVFECFQSSISMLQKAFKHAIFRDKRGG